MATFERFESFDEWFAKECRDPFDQAKRVAGKCNRCRREGEVLVGDDLLREDGVCVICLATQYGHERTWDQLVRGAIFGVLNAAWEGDLPRDDLMDRLLRQAKEDYKRDRVKETRDYCQTLLKEPTAQDRADARAMLGHLEVEGLVA